MHGQYHQNWGLGLTHHNTNPYSHQIIPVDDEEIHWELSHALYEADVLADATDYTSQFAAVMDEQDWTNDAAIGDAVLVLQPLIRMVDELFDLEEIAYTDNVQARYFDQIAWMYLYLYAHAHLHYQQHDQ